MLLAVGLLAAMYSLLLLFNRQRVPGWGYSINLSTLLAILATFFRSIIVIIIGQIISQSKWAWFSKTRSRPLQHLQVFGYGNRSTLGSVFLLPKVLKGSLGTTLAA
jgi:hypothetical protein